MSNTKYLYGASVQGIQSFIFKTNKLSEMAGASSIVEQICTSFFKNAVKNYNDGNLIIGAAGNIKYLFENELDCSELVRKFPKIVMENAYGITISQAVVKVNGHLTIEDLNMLEERLKIQRNFQYPPLDFGLQIMERSRSTGNSAISIEKDRKGVTEYIDKSTSQKRKAEINNSGILAEKLRLTDFYRNFEEITGTNEGSGWLAIIHADGNGLGKVIQHLGGALKGKVESEVIRAFKSFSENLENANLKATQNALGQVFPKEIFTGTLPFRPIILAGDDLTVVIRADSAIEFIEAYLKEFEIQTKEKLGELFKKYGLGINHLTACAGIAYAKTAFPFHYSYHLAEVLCGVAKIDSKKAQEKEKLKAQPSSLLFYKIDSSILSDYKDIITKSLTCYDGLSFAYGPYYIDESLNKPTISKLISGAKIVLKPGAPASQLRKWLGVRYRSKEEANELMKRTVQILNQRKEIKKFVELLNLEEWTKSKHEPTCPFYDYLALASFHKNQFSTEDYNQ